MNYKKLGSTGVKVSELCFGTMSFGGDADKSESKLMFDSCLDAGINFFDCANVYQKGVAEQYLGEFMSGKRQDLVITSKVYFPMTGDVNASGASRKNIQRELEASLKRLGTDYIDLYFIHLFDEETALHETLFALNDCIRSGKILYIGLSNYAAWQVQKAIGLAQLNNLVGPHCIQPMYNLVKRQAEVELLPMAASEGLGAISYSPLGGGLLSGKFTGKNKPETARLQDNEMYARRYGNPSYMEVAEKFSEYATEHDVHPATLAVSWVKDRPGITSAIIGARNTKQLEASLAAAQYSVSPEMYAELDSISPPPPPATDRSEEAAGFSYVQMLK